MFWRKKAPKETFKGLMQQLVNLVNEANEWAYRSGSYPPVRQHPQYDQIREIGEKIHDIAGFNGMQDACELLKVVCKHPDQNQPSHSIVKYAWDGIGEWMP